VWQISRQLDANAQSLDGNFSALLQAHDNQSKMLNEKLSALVQALDNQSDLLSEKLSALAQGIDNQSELLNRKLDDIRFKSATSVELQQAELVMQRDVMDAMHEAMRSIKGPKSAQARANQAREEARTPLT
jgi:ABC-type transporter Mla subunit MlaD